MKSIKLQLFFVVLAFLTMIVVSILYVRAIVNQHMAINSEEIMGSANATIQSLLSEAEITLANVAFSIDNLLHEDTSFENIEKFFVSVSRWHDTDKREYFAFNGLYGFINDRYIDGSGWVPPADYNPRMRPWYIGAAVTNDIYYTDPYTDADSGNTVISVSKKLGVTDPASVIAIDFDITAVSEYIENLHIASGGYGMLINNRMEIVSHENHEMTGQSVAVATSPYHSFADVLMNDDPKEITSLRVTDYNGKHSIVFISRLFNGWHIAIITPLSSYYDQLRTMAIVISLLGTVLTAVLCIILLKLNSEKAKADEKNQMKSSFLAKMSHEIRTPMNAIAGMSELILRDADSIPKKTFGHALAIKQASANLLSIINDILDFSKIESGKMEIAEVKYMLSSLINDVINIIRLRLQEKPIYFIVNIDPNIPNNLIGDEVRIRQMLINILSNAAKYTHEGYVSLTLNGHKTIDDTVKLSFIVADSGVGIKDKDMAKLFSEFMQFDKDSNIEGTGLGLAITKNLAQLMGGDITVSSNYGEGSTFTLILPQQIETFEVFAEVPNSYEKHVLLYENRYLYAESISKTLNSLNVQYKLVDSDENLLKELQKSYYYVFIAADLYEHISNTANWGPKKIAVIADIGDTRNWGNNIRSLIMPAHAMSIANVLNNVPDTVIYGDNAATVRFKFPKARILIVDDISTNLSVAEGLLLPFEMQMDFALSGMDAIKLVEQHEYDLIFMDHMMPEMDGIEATQRIRQINENVPIIALTANAVSGMREVFLKNGMDDFLPKPIEPAKIVAMLFKWIPQEKREKRSADEAPKMVNGLFIPGLDIQKGIALTGSEDAYLKILELFRTDTEKKIALLQEALDNEDLKNYTIYVHGLKSSLATIGGTELSAMAQSLETAAKENSRMFIEEHHERYIVKLRKLLENIAHRGN